MRRVLWLVVLCSCGEPSEAPRVELPVFVDDTGAVAVTTDLGYTVELTTARMAFADLELTVAGEVHTALWRRAADWLLPVAHAHPGHVQGGEVTGELPGRFVVDWIDGAGTELGTATLIAGAYEGANFTFVRAGSEDGVDAGDPLLGHTARLAGTATSATSEIEFVATIDSPEDRELIGAPFAHRVAEGAHERLGVRLVTVDPLEADTLFDGIDFAALDTDADGAIEIDELSVEPAVVDAANLLRRTFQTHDHFDIQASSL